MYEVIILVHSEFEGGRNPLFTFETFEQATRFMITCFANGYGVEASYNDGESNG
jgi:hypothetical protein